MPKPLKPTSIKFEAAQLKFLKRLAHAQGHGKLSRTVKKLVDREMAMTA